MNTPSGTAIIPDITSSLDVLQGLALSTESVPMEYEWTYLNKQWTWDMDIPEALCDYYKALPRPSTDDYSIYVSHPLDDEYIDNLALKLKESALEEGYDKFQTVSLAASFVQSLPYTSDSVTTGYDEYPRYPVETLIDDGGDCEDTAILAASLIQAMGYGVVLIEFPTHLAVGVKGDASVRGTYWEYDGSRYYYLETTGTGWEIGEIPPEYKGVSARIYETVPVPILTSSWTFEGTTRQVQLKVKVDNLGTARARGVYVKAGFDAGNGNWWNSEESPQIDIEINSSAEYTLYLNPPYGEYTRLIVRVVYNGYDADVTYSDWFDTY